MKARENPFAEKAIPEHEHAASAQDEVQKANTSQDVQEHDINSVWIYMYPHVVEDSPSVVAATPDKLPPAAKGGCENFIQVEKGEFPLNPDSYEK